MKKSVLALTLAASFGLAACNSGKEVVVSTTYGDITKDEFYEEVKSLAGTALLEQVVMDKILSEKYKVTDEEIKKELETYKAQYGDQFESLLSANGLTEETFKESLRFQLLQRKATEDVEVTDKEIKEYYEQGKYELNGRHILVATKEEADAIVKQLKEGADFAKLAKEKSTDTGSGANGGELGWFTVGKMVKPFNDAAYALKLNTISEPVQSEFGYHIIEIKEKREVKDYGTLKEKKDEIKDAIKAQKAQSANWDEIEAKLLEEAKIDVKDEDLKGAFGKADAEDKKEEDKK